MTLSLRVWCGVWEVPRPSKLGAQAPPSRRAATLGGRLAPGLLRAAARGSEPVARSHPPGGTCPTPGPRPTSNPDRPILDRYLGIQPGAQSLARRGPGAPGQRSLRAPGCPPAPSPPAPRAGRYPSLWREVTWRSAPGSLRRPGAHSPGPGSRRQEAVEGGGRRDCDGGGGGAGGLGAPAGWEDRAQNGCWAKEGSGMEGPTLDREGKDDLLLLFVVCLNPCRTVDVECLAC